MSPEEISKVIQQWKDDYKKLLEYLLDQKYIYDYNLIDRGKDALDIYIIPNKPVEYIKLNVIVANSNISFDEVINDQTTM